jgi:hypothetical protein
VPRIPKPSSELRKKLEAAGLSTEDLSRMFRVSERSVRSWTNGARRVPHWLMPALEIYTLLSPAGREALGKSLTSDGSPGRGSKAAPNRARANAARHPFARIEEL